MNTAHNVGTLGLGMASTHWSAVHGRVLQLDCTMWLDELRDVKLLGETVPCYTQSFDVQSNPVHCCKLHCSSVAWVLGISIMK